MNSTAVLACCFAIGLIAGLRSMTAPATVSWAAHLNWINLHNSRLSFLGSTAAVCILTVFALAELVVDKLPSTPSRTSAIPLGTRIVTGALSGAALGIAGNVNPYLGAILGAIGGIAGAFGGYQVRHNLVVNAKLPDKVVAIMEDLIAIGGGLLICSRF
jgi:uncharacterized membrane protein